MKNELTPSAYVIAENYLNNLLNQTTLVGNELTLTNQIAIEELGNDLIMLIDAKTGILTMDYNFVRFLYNKFGLNDEITLMMLEYALLNHSDFFKNKRLEFVNI